MRVFFISTTKWQNNLLTSDALVATELMLGDSADSGLAFKPYG